MQKYILSNFLLVENGKSVKILLALVDKLAHSEINFITFGMDALM